MVKNKNVLIINGHPDKDSFNYALSASFKEGLAKTNCSIEEINIAELSFNPNLQFGYRKRMEPEPDLLIAISKIKQADHLVWIFPMWWYGYPAIMKGFIDRTFLPGIAFENVPGKIFHKKLFLGKSAHLIITADTPAWYDALFMRSPLINQFKKGTLKFCGIKPVKVTYLASIKYATPEKRDKWLKKMYVSGLKTK